ncbi:MAG TPA: chorismate mutase [Gemmatimonadaceae bacterium]|nr:chorismate mutase [Gemmatimonadaceae bacterium]
MMLAGAPRESVRLATSCAENSAAAIDDAVRELVDTFHRRNTDCPARAVSLVLFTATNDLRAAKPATAARRAGWSEAQFLCLAEMPTDDDVALCIRALVFVQREGNAERLRPVYLRDAQRLRPDLVAD